MPINLPNWAQHETKDYGPGNLLESALEGYKMSRVPAQMKREEQRQAELVQQLQHGNYKAGLENQYLPHELENKQIQSDINTKYLGPEKEAGLRGTNLLNRHQELVNQIAEATGMDAAKADVYLKQQQAKYAHLTHMTPEQRNAQAAGYEPGSEEYQQIMRGGLGIFEPPKDEKGNPLPVPRYAQSLMGKGLNERAHYETEMRKNVERGEQAKVANHNVDEIIRITKASPKLNRSWSYIAEDPEMINPGTWKKAISGLNEAEKTQVQILAKLTNEMVLAQDAVQPGKGSDARRQMVAASKPGVGMTDAARLKIAENIKGKNQPFIDYADEAAPWIGSVYIPYQAKNYQKKTEEPSIEAALKEGQTKTPEELQKARTQQIAEKIAQQENQPGGSKATVPYKINGILKYIPINEVPELKADAEKNKWTLEEIPLGGIAP